MSEKISPTRDVPVCVRNVPDNLDLHFGGRLREARKAAGLSQSRLGAALGVSFQQVQKYERGLDRISGSKLYISCVVLKVEPSYFFDGLPNIQKIWIDKSAQDIESGAIDQLIKDFVRITEPSTRRHLLAIARALAKQCQLEPFEN